MLGHRLTGAHQIAILSRHISTWSQNAHLRASFKVALHAQVTTLDKLRKVLLPRFHRKRILATTAKLAPASTHLSVW
jgi:hypothetical protein